MKRFFSLIFATISLVSLTLSLHAQQKVISKVPQFKLDLSKSKILWKAPKNHGGSSHFGYVLFTNGNLLSNSNGIPTSASFVIDMNSVRSIDNRDQKKNDNVDLELKSKDFFDVARFQTAIMIVKKVVPTKTPSVFTITGELMMKGVTNTIYFNASIKNINNQIKVTANLEIDRLRWNVKNTEGNFLGGVKNMLIEEKIPIALDLLFTKM
jgi:hypothetical protein